MSEKLDDSQWVPPQSSDHGGDGASASDTDSNEPATPSSAEKVTSPERELVTRKMTLLELPEDILMLIFKEVS